MNNAYRKKKKQFVCGTSKRFSYKPFGCFFPFFFFFFLLFFLHIITIITMSIVKEFSGLLRFVQLFNDLLDNRYLRHVKNIIFVLVVLNYWSKLYNQVLIGGPRRAFQDLKTYIIKVDCISKKMKKKLSDHWV